MPRHALPTIARQQKGEERVFRSAANPYTLPIQFMPNTPGPAAQEPPEPHLTFAGSFTHFALVYD